MAEKWCEHIVKCHNDPMGDWAWANGGCHIPSSWNVCPVEGCNRPRPQQKKSLAEVMSDAYWAASHSDDDRASAFESVAQSAKDHLLGEDKAEQIAKIFMEWSYESSLERAKRILEYLRSER